jgi:hypothetical protein
MNPNVHANMEARRRVLELIRAHGASKFAAPSFRRFQRPLTPSGLAQPPTPAERDSWENARKLRDFILSTGVTVDIHQADNQVKTYTPENVQQLRSLYLPPRVTLERFDVPSDSAASTVAGFTGQPATGYEAQLRFTVSPSAAPAVVVTSTEMAPHADAGIPVVNFPRKPEGWKGDPGNPNFKTLGTLSPPVMRKIEPVGPAFLSHARRVRSLAAACLLLLTNVETSWPYLLGR